MLLQFKELWSDREINIINNMILELVDINVGDDEEVDNSLIDAIEIILNKKEDIVGDIILQNTTKLE